MAKPSKKIRGVRQKIQKRKAKKRAKKRKREARRSRAKTKAKLKTAPARKEVSDTKEQLKGLADDTGVSKISSKAASLVGSAGDQFDKVGGADFDGDGVLEANELGFGLDLDNDGQIEPGEVFTPAKVTDSDGKMEQSEEPAPQQQDPSRVPGLDRFLVDAGPPADQSEQPQEQGDGLDEYLL